MGQDGDYLGNFFDIGLSAQAALVHNLVTRDIGPTSEFSTLMTERTTILVMNNHNHWNVNITSRIGLDRFSLVASWRLTSILRETDKTDLPSFQIGLEFAPIRY